MLVLYGSVVNKIPKYEWQHNASNFWISLHGMTIQYQMNL